MAALAPTPAGGSAWGGAERVSFRTARPLYRQTAARMLLAAPQSCLQLSRACAVRLSRSRRAAMATAASGSPLRIAFVTGNAKKLAEARGTAAAACAASPARVCRPRGAARHRLSTRPQVQAILGTEHAARFVLDAVGLDLPELQARARASAASGVACRVAALRRRRRYARCVVTAGRARGGCSGEGTPRGRAHRVRASRQPLQRTHARQAATDVQGC